MRHFVQARGEATYDVGTNKISSLYIKDLETIDEISADGSTQVQLSSFWKGKTFDDLATEQGVYPVDDIGILSEDWPEDTDFDTFLDAVRSARD